MRKITAEEYPLRKGRSQGARWGIGRVEMALPASAQIYRTGKKKKKEGAVWGKSKRKAQLARFLSGISQMILKIMWQDRGEHQVLP